MPTLYLTTAEAAARLGIHPSRVRHLIRENRIQSKKVGPYNLIPERSLAAVENRKPGRPRKNPKEKKP